MAQSYKNVICKLAYMNTITLLLRLSHATEEPLLTSFFSLICLCQLTRPLAITPGSGAIAQAPPPRAAVATPNQPQAVMNQEELMMSMVGNLASLTSRTSMSVVVIGGVVGNILIQQCVKSNDLTKNVFGNIVHLLFFLAELMFFVSLYHSTVEFSAFLSYCDVRGIIQGGNSNSMPCHTTQLWITFP